MNTISTQPAARTPVYNGEIQFRADVEVSVHEVWRALTDQTSLRRWFGDLNGELRPQQDARLDCGDGDFLVLRVLRLQEPNELEYLTRFLGIGPVSKISWSVVPQGSGSCIGLVADVGQRLEESGEPPVPDWKALGDRLVRYVSSGEITRRRPTDAIDASVELPVPIRQAWNSLFEGENQREWLPIDDPILDIDSEFRITTSPRPARVEQIARQYLRRVDFVVNDQEWLNPMRISLSLAEHGAGSLLRVTQVGGQVLCMCGACGGARRQRAVQLWISSLTQARQLAG